MIITPTFSPHYHLAPLNVGSIRLTDGFWERYQEKVNLVSIYHALDMFQQYGYFENLLIAAGKSTKEFRGRNFLDSDLYKWIEASALCLRYQDNERLRDEVDHLLFLLQDIQWDDGYINSYYTAVAPQSRWHDLDHGHELYTAGHMFEAAVTLKQYAGDDRLLKMAVRMADHMYQRFIVDGQKGSPGHPEVELALVELFRETNDERYLHLAKHFLDQRGQKRMIGYDGMGPEYHQDHLPVRESTQAVGHAVRQLYLAAGVVDVFLESGDQTLLNASESLWQDIQQYRTFVTGGYGSRFQGESFGDAYELPSDLCYCETCASIAAMMWNWRLLLATGKVQYAHAIERGLYNGFLSGMSQDGEHFFYTNPLQSREGAQRKPWFGVACCPPNIMRQIMAVGQYVATSSENAIQIHQYINSCVEKPGFAKIQIKSDFPWKGNTLLTILQTSGNNWRLELRVPEWVDHWTLLVNGKTQQVISQRGYIQVERAWQCGDQVEIYYPMEPRWLYPHFKIDALRGCAALQRGPLIYCLEGIDHPDDKQLLGIQADPQQILESVWNSDLLSGVMTIRGSACIQVSKDPNPVLYTYSAMTTHSIPITFTAIPYYLWANRGKNAMRVWLPIKQ